MSMRNKLRVALVGLGFGAEFVPIYLDHPDIESVAICDKNEERLQGIGERFNVTQRYRDIEDVIGSDDFDAVHLGTCIMKATQTAKCPIDIESLKTKVQKVFNKEVIFGTHPY